MSDLGTALLLAIPILIIEIILIVISLVDLSKRKKVQFDNKIIWVIIIVFLNLIGPILYLAWGRHAEDKESDNGSSYKD
jgi:hypothetical protein